MYREKIRLPLKVKFVGEDGMDHGALRLEFLTLLLDDFADTIDATHRLYIQSQISTGSAHEELNTPLLNSRLYAFGLFSALAILQCNLLEPFVVTWVTKLATRTAGQTTVGIVGRHSFIQGLEELEVASVSAVGRRIF